MHCRYAKAKPHVYSIAERAYARMRSVGANQAIVMSGESGAGKTETAKHVMRYVRCIVPGCSAAI